MNRLGGERESIQRPLIQYVSQSPEEYLRSRVEIIKDSSKDLGWTYITPEEALRLRGGEAGLIFRDVFIKQMQRLNPGFIDHTQAEELIKKIERIPPNIEGNLIAWEYLRGLKTAFIPHEKRERNIRFIDTENLERNIFHVTDEFTFTNGSKTIRPDVVFLINGVPIFLVETKSAHRIEGIAEALDQLRRYHYEGPELMALLQVYSLTHLIQFYYGPTWNTSRKGLLNWKEESKGEYETLVKLFFDRERVIRVLSDFILFTRKDDRLEKVVLRPHQMRAVEKLLERAEEREIKRGLIWHTQGSGKTYTMIVAAKKLIEDPLFESPTVIMLVDRNELEQQLFDNLKSVGFEIDPERVAKRKEHLQQLLGRDTRGLIVSMIHKFEGIPENMIMRENVFVLIDEAHRTTEGKLGNYLMGALPNATYIGFTGTPVDKTPRGKGTFVIFGRDDPPKGYLDKYSISESIEDGTTVPLHYTLAPNELRVDKETLNREFLELAEVEGVSDQEELSKVLEKAVTLKTMLKKRERAEVVAGHVAKHFKETIEPMGYKAFLVGVDREACAAYKELLDRHLPTDYSQVVISRYNDPPELAKYHLSETKEKEIRNAFKKADELPKILIVTEKLLTGFDAPILYCMYLDKPMRDHVLLQAIARVNRPYEDGEGRKKPSGFVLDFVGIFENLERALAFDSTDIEGVIRDIAVLKERFLNLMENARRAYLSVLKDKSEDKAVEAILVYFMDEEKRHEYYSFFRELSDIYEILSPDAFLRPFIDDYETLARIYRILNEAFEPGLLIDRDFSRKTAKLVQKHTITGPIKGTLDVYEINEVTLKKLEESKTSDTEKVFNLLKSLRKTITEKSLHSPFLISIGERAEQIAKLYQQRQMTTRQALDELKKLIDEVNLARREQVERQMSPEVFSMFWLLKKEGIEEAEKKANQVKEIMDKFPHWKSSARHEREVRVELYSVLINSAKKAEDVTETAKRIMRIIKGGIEV